MDGCPLSGSAVVDTDSPRGFRAAKSTQLSDSNRNSVCHDHVPRYQWQIGAKVLQPIIHRVTRQTVANRSDGSLVMLTDSGYTYLYSALSDKVLRIDHTAKTISRRDPLIWHDRPYRRAKDDDSRCATGVLHFGTDLHMTGDATVAGIPVRRWERGDGWYWHEEVYLAPSLDCAVLKLYTIRRNRLLVPTYVWSVEASSVKMGDPDAVLFAIPADYHEVKDPSEDGLREFVRRNAPGR